MFRFGEPGGRMYSTLGSGNVNLLANWNYSSGNVSVVSGGGRTTGSCLRIDNNFGASYVEKYFDEQPTWGIAFAFRPNFVIGSTTFILVLEENTTQVDLRLNLNGSITATRNGTALGTSSFILPFNVFTHIELLTTIDPSAGSLVVRADGVDIIGPLTGINTSGTGSSTANVIQICVLGFNSGQDVKFDYDDFIVYDGQTTDGNGKPDIHGLIGDCGLAWLQPTGAGTTTNFTIGGTSSGANWSQLNDAAPDGDTTYVQDGTLGDIDTYAMGYLPTSAATVLSVAVVHYCEKTDVGSKSLGCVIRTGGTNYTHTTLVGLTNGYTYSFLNWGENPYTSAAWSVTDINGFETGQKVAS